MDFKGRYAISAPPEAVWAALHDPQILTRAIPGCETLEKISATEFKAKAAVTIGPVKTRFEGKMQLTPHQPEAGFSHALTLKGEAHGGAASFARAESEVRLAPLEGGTILSYDAKAIVGGRLAQIGQRLIDGAAKSLMDEFFAKFAALIERLEAPAPGCPASPSPDGVAKAEGLPPAAWVVALIAIVLILLAVFSFVL